MVRGAAALVLWALCLAASPVRAAPPGGRAWTDVAYGADARQRFDVYAPGGPSPSAQGAPVIFMVHGGAWRFGDRALPRVVDNKRDYRNAAGYVFISAGYRLLPDTPVSEQARDLARALAAAQAGAAAWGGDARRFVLMGHSAGAHLVALLAASPALLREAGALPVIGTVALDSAAFDVPRLMGGRHLPLYDRAFGRDPDYWRTCSPQHALQQRMAPLLAVCSSRRVESCAAARRFVEQALHLGGRAEVLPRDLSHGEINAELGLPGAYTAAVAAFLDALR